MASGRSSRCADIAPGQRYEQRGVYLYRGEGTGYRSVKSTAQSLTKLLPANFQVREVDAEEVLGGRWQKDCALFVLPGGADLPYCRRFNGRGNQLIRRGRCLPRAMCGGLLWLCQSSV